MVNSFWSSFSNDKKIPIFPPLYHIGKGVTDFKQKVELIKSFFAKQCSVLQKSSKLQTNAITRTDQFLAPLTFFQDDNFKIIQSLNPNKSHGPDKVSVLYDQIFNYVKL